MDMRKILQAIDGASSKPVEGSNDMKRFVQIVNEGTSPHKVSLPVQMTMQHYQKSQPAKQKDTLLKKYFMEAEEEILKEKEQRRALINQYASVIAERVRLKNKED